MILTSELATEYETQVKSKEKISYLFEGSNLYKLDLQEENKKSDRTNNIGITPTEIKRRTKSNDNSYLVRKYAQLYPEKNK